MKEGTNAQMVFNDVLVQQISEIKKIISRICLINLAKYSCIAKGELTAKGSSVRDLYFQYLIYGIILNSI